jgi:hypothetical protein
MQLNSTESAKATAVGDQEVFARNEGADLSQKKSSAKLSTLSSIDGVTEKSSNSNSENSTNQKSSTHSDTPASISGSNNSTILKSSSSKNSKKNRSNALPIASSEQDENGPSDDDGSDFDQSSITLTFPKANKRSASIISSPLDVNSSFENLSSLRANFSPLEYLSNNRSVDNLNLLSSDFLTSIKAPHINDCYSFNGRSIGLSVDLYTGINYAAKDLKAQGSEPISNEYIRSRESSENYLEAFEAGININLIHRSGIMASTGINYSQIDEEFNYFSVHTETIFDSVLVRIIIDSTGHADSIREWRPTSVQTAREILAYNYFRSVDIPLAVGYQFHRGKWTIEAQGGVLFNLLFKKKGQILNESLSEVLIDDNTSLFKDRLGMSAFASVKAIYPITDRIGLYAEPFGRFNLKSITVPEYTLSQKYNQFGLRLGARLTI